MEETFDQMRQKDKDDFRRAANRLMSCCFIVRKNEKTKSDYYFILSKRKIFEKYLSVLGCSLEINEEYGVIQLVNRVNYNHLHLKMMESIILLILRILYDEKKRELSLTDVVVNIGEIQEKFLSLKIRDKQIDKTVLNNSLRLLRRFNLIELLDKNSMEEDARVLIYDSILMAVRVDDIKKAASLAAKYKKGGKESADETSETGPAD